MSESYWTDQVALVYRELEEELIEIIIKRLKVGTNNKKDITQWQFEKLQDLGLVNRETIKKIAKATGQAEEVVEEAFRVGPNEVISQVDRASQKPRKVPSTNTDQIIKGYAKQAKNQLNMTGEGLGVRTYGYRDTINKYRRVVERTASFVNAGIHTLEQAVERASHEILTEGLKMTLTSKDGRQIPVDSHVRTVMKTTLARTYDEVRKEHMEEYGMHHVVVGSLVGAREACSKIQGQVVDLRPMEEIPEGSEYRSIYDPYWEAHYKEPGGHHGINCRHPHFPFIPGVNTNNQPQYDEELNRQVAKDQQRQRSLERQIRNYKKHLKIAQEFGNQKDIDRYTKLISGRQKALREHLDGHKYLSRDYARERAFDFTSSPPKDIIKPEVVEYFKSRGLNQSQNFFGKQPEYDKWVSRLNDTQKDAIKEYSGDLYEHMNKYLREGESYLNRLEFPMEEDSGFVDGVINYTRSLDNALKGYTTPEPFRVFREVAAHELPEDLLADLTNARPGKQLVLDSAFQSTTMHKQAEGMFGDILYEIEIPEGIKDAGAYIANHAYDEYEDEFLIRPNAEYEILENNLASEEPYVRLRLIG